jgi:kynurenine--oxoglutarate transaminase/cysteine-S-conjugate beta-lyase/glutamine--phenylpyruvate transaminase
MKINLIKKAYSNFSYSLPNKIKGYETPTIWYKFSRLAMTTGSVNLGQGFPDWGPPEFFLQNLEKNIKNSNANHQYSRSFGNLKLCEAISNKYSLILERKVDPVNEILVANGATSLLYSAITGLVEQGDEVITMEPFYDCYLPQVKFSGGKLIGIPMIPPKFRSKSEYKNLSLKTPKDEWKIDFEKFKNSLNDKTKLIILNTPNNPSGKILTYDELSELAKIIKNYPRIVILMDEVYEHMVFDEFQELPRMVKLEGLWDRCISIMSAGKFFSATGIRLGWCIGPKKLITIVNSIHQFSSFCQYDPLQLALADTLNDANKPYKGFKDYYTWLRQHFINSRNYFVENLAKIEHFDLDFYFPDGGYFIIADISKKQNLPLYKFEGEENQENNYGKDFNYLLNLAHERKVVGIPCSNFYTEPNRHYGENFIRFAFCKQKKTMDDAFNNLKK